MCKKVVALACFLLAVVLFSGCKKERIQQKPDEPDDAAPQLPEWVSYKTSNSPLPHNQVNALSIAANNTVWIGTANGLARLKGKAWTIFNSGNSALPSNSIQALATEANGTIWVGTDSGLARYNGAQWVVYTSQNSLLTNNHVKCITHDAAHATTWVGTEDGIIKIQQNNWTYIDVFNTLLSMAVDHEGNLWTGEFNDFAFIGMIKKYSNGQRTTHRLDQMGYASALPYAIGVDSKNRVVAALAGTVVKSVIRLEGTMWQELDRPENARGIKAMALQADQVWIGGATFSQFGKKDNTLIQMPTNEFPIISMALDGNGRKWLGTLYDGVAVYNDEKK